MSSICKDIGIWVLSQENSLDCQERLGDARRLATDMELGVGAVELDGDESAGRSLIEGGADL